MSIPEPTAASDSALFLAERWRARALSAGWLHPDDWFGIAVSVMTRAVLDQVGLEQAASKLGADRAARGVGIREALADLGTLYEVADDSTPPFDVTTAFVEAWSAVSTATLFARGTTDSLTGLCTIDYLTARLRELYEEHRETGVRAPDGWCFILITGGFLTGWRRVLRNSAVARVVNEVLNAGQSKAILPSESIVCVVRPATANEHAIRLRHRLLALPDTEGVTVTTQLLPDDLDQALALIATL